MTERAEKAQELHNAGYNCAQAVVCAYCDLFGADKDEACKMAEGFGLGMGCMEVCGALTGAFMLAGLANSKGIDHPGETKRDTYKLTKQMAQAFQAQNESILCRELKGTVDGKVRRSCPECIEDGCRLVEEFLMK